jgi:hypothetical protein
MPWGLDGSKQLPPPPPRKTKSRHDSQSMHDSSRDRLTQRRAAAVTTLRAELNV